MLITRETCPEIYITSQLPRAGSSRALELALVEIIHARHAGESLYSLTNRDWRDAITAARLSLSTAV